LTLQVVMNINRSMILMNHRNLHSQYLAEGDPPLSQRHNPLSPRTTIYHRSLHKNHHHTDHYHLGCGLLHLSIPRTLHQTLHRVARAPQVGSNPTHHPSQSDLRFGHRSQDQSCQINVPQWLRHHPVIFWLNKAHMSSYMPSIPAQYSHPVTYLNMWSLTPRSPSPSPHSLVMSGYLVSILLPFLSQLNQMNSQEGICLEATTFDTFDCGSMTHDFHHASQIDLDAQTSSLSQTELVNDVYIIHCYSSGCSTPRVSRELALASCHHGE